MCLVHGPAGYPAGAAHASRCWHLFRPSRFATPLPVSHVFASDEVFYDLAQDRWYRTRAQLGLGRALDKVGEVQMYYLRQDTYLGAPRVLQVIGWTWKLVLN